MKRVIDMSFRAAKLWIERIVVAAVSLAVAACGGSGSSGFDGEPAGEPQVIEKAVTEGTCFELEGVTYCGSGAPFTAPTGDGTVTIDEPAAPVECTQVPGEDACVADVDFTPDGFPGATFYLVASADSFAGPWLLSADVPPPSSGGQADGREVDVEVPSRPGSPPTTPLIVAVLVYLDALPQNVPDQVVELSGLEPDVVYVSRELDVEPSSPGNPS
jgi:hypothetical protein